MPRILIIDDDDQFRRMLQITLKKAGYEADTASNGQKGLDFLAKHSVDLVITDIVMPDKEGIETIAEICRKFHGLKIIAISGGGRIGPQSYLDLAGQLGALRTFAKPLVMIEFLAAVRELTHSEL